MKDASQLFKSKSGIPSTEPKNQGNFKPYNNLFKKKWAGLRHVFKEGENYFRILPRHNDSSENEFFKLIEIVSIKDRLFVDPSTFGEDSICRKFHSALRNHSDPKIAGRIKSKTNLEGISTYPKRQFIGFILRVSEKGEDAEAGKELSLVHLSANDGERGQPGIGYKIVDLLNQVNNDPTLPPEEQGKPKYGDISDPKEGRLVIVNRTGSGQNTTYDASASSNIDNKDLIERLSLIPDQVDNYFTDLSDVLYQPSEEELIEAIKDYVGEDLFYQVLPEYKEGSDTEVDTTDIQIPGDENTTAPANNQVQTEEKPKENNTQPATTAQTEYGDASKGLDGDINLVVKLVQDCGEASTKDAAIAFMKEAFANTQDDMKATITSLITDEEVKTAIGL